MFYSITLTHILTLSSVLLVLGLVGIVLNRRNIIAILMCLELILLSANINLVATSHFRADLAGHIFTFFILTVAAAELAIGLAIVTLFFRNRGDIEIDSADRMRG
ncbi:MAG: NADH-quinone oxidoreductase subunit NuoK [Pseudomonadaceae bacterium]|nr:NADH-quinone oxidoreductase subunit NuoK [Pseudomonadaceae bacterium]